MKKIILIAIILVATCVSYGQDKEPTQVKFKLYADTTEHLSAEHPVFKQDKMILGWHWDYGRNKKLSEALGCNKMHGKVNYDSVFYQPSPYVYEKWVFDANTSNLGDSLNFIICAPVVGHNWECGTPVNSMAMEYEPTLEILNPSEFQTRDEGIFGFQNVGGDISNNPGDENYGRLMLRKDSTGHIGTVLSNAWMTDAFDYRIVEFEDTDPFYMYY
jgi:hypothetical protein